MLRESNGNLFSSGFSWGVRYITKCKNRAYQGELWNEGFKKSLREKMVHALRGRQAGGIAGYSMVLNQLLD